MTKRSLVLIIFASLTSTAVSAQQLRIETEFHGSAAPIGETADLRIRLGTGSVDVDGWSFGVSVDPALIELTSVTLSEAMQSVAAATPPDFEQVTFLAGGFTAEMVFCFASCAAVPSSVAWIEIYDVECETVAAGDVEFAFTGTLGSPPVPVQLVGGGAVVVPDTTGTEFTNGEHADWEFTLSNETVEFDIALGEAEFEVTAGIGQYNTPWYSDSPAFSMGIAHDPALLQGVSITMAPALADLNEGTGPSFFAAEIYPEGMTVGAVFSLVGAESLQFIGDTPVLFLGYETVPAALIGSGDLETEVEYTNDIGAPPVVTLINPGDSGWLPFTIPGAITLISQQGQLYVRGDINDDGGVDLGDTVFLLDWLFVGGPDPFCEIVGDINTDGAVDLGDPICILQFLFAGGHPPDAPYPDCGYVATDDCAVGSSHCP